ncbi:MAG: hypothetical protein QMD53_02015 [Actinomycetota bacterium]|nr:hypothetical protein [Actinomycetota bacterium]
MAYDSILLRLFVRHNVDFSKSKASPSYGLDGFIAGHALHVGNGYGALERDSNRAPLSDACACLRVLLDHPALSIILFEIIFICKLKAGLIQKGDGLFQGLIAKVRNDHPPSEEKIKDQKGAQKDGQPKGSELKIRG